MPQDNQPEFEMPAILRLPQVPPLKVPARRQTQFIAQPAPARYTEEVPVTPPLAPENDLFMPVPVTPPLNHQPQIWMRAPEPVNHAGTGISIIPGGKSEYRRDAIHRVRSMPAPTSIQGGHRGGRGSGHNRGRDGGHNGGRDESRPYRYPQGWVAGHVPVSRYIPTGRRSRDVGNGEFLLGCVFLIFIALLALGLLTWLTSAR